MTSNQHLYGPRLYFRKPEVSDALRYVTWLNDPRIRSTLSFTRPISLFREEQYLKTLSDDPLSLVLAVCTRKEQRHIGGAGLHKIDIFNQRAEVGLFIGEPSLWNQGYGREIMHLLLGYCFNQLDLNRACLNVYPFNPGAIALYEGLGFQKEGTYRDALFRKGQYHDVLEYSMLQREYRERLPNYPDWVQELAR